MPPYRTPKHRYVCYETLLPSEWYRKLPLSTGSTSPVSQLVYTTPVLPASLSYHSISKWPWQARPQEESEVILHIGPLRVGLLESIAVS